MIRSSPNERLAAVARDNAASGGRTDWKTAFFSSRECGKASAAEPYSVASSPLELDRPTISAIAQGARERIGASRQMPPVCRWLFSLPKCHLRASHTTPRRADMSPTVIVAHIHPLLGRLSRRRCDRTHELRSWLG